MDKKKEEKETPEQETPEKEEEPAEEQEPAEEEPETEEEGEAETSENAEEKTSNPPPNTTRETLPSGHVVFRDSETGDVVGEVAPSLDDLEAQPGAKDDPQEHQENIEASSDSTTNGSDGKQEQREKRESGREEEGEWNPFDWWSNV